MLKEHMDKDTEAKPNVNSSSSSLATFDRRTGVIETALHYFGMVVLVGLALMVVVQVTARYVFLNPIEGYIDFMSMMMSILVFVTVAYSQREGGHIRVEIFIDKVLKGGRAFHIVESIFLLIALATFSIIAVSSAVDTVEAYMANDISMTVHFPLWPARMWVPIGCALLCIRFALQLRYQVTAALAGRIEELAPEKAYMED